MALDQPPPYVVIDLRAIYDQLIVLNTKVERLVSKQDEHERDNADHEARLRSLEKGRWPLPSVALLVSLASLGLAVATR
ncbi:hypothetical protein Cme02nite_69470 [Catellatospora methionotrophica]|uniref:Uncharacterized protein n=1 Tax=Catellatospora methionotrophica TaxID=121620 RepID=A0A8J3LTR4_9ACTN|nr:hypothetical protein [Catellatospora methionotrophica]GIG18615.1 hypothetical protein Cme02nite_69470 [Catellatospora methionotrophica]